MDAVDLDHLLEESYASLQLCEIVLVKCDLIVIISLGISSSVSCFISCFGVRA